MSPDECLQWTSPQWQGRACVLCGRWFSLTLLPAPVDNPQTGEQRAKLRQCRDYTGCLFARYGPGGPLTWGRS